jgi:potassium-transporting ATPase KdpC subunit
MQRLIWPAVSLTACLLLLTGVAYPALLYAIGHELLSARADGSLIRRPDGRVVGSALLGQAFSSPIYFHGRPSAVGYDAANSGASNLASTNPRQADSLVRRAERFRADNGLRPDTPLPPDAITASGSGLDPDISPDNAALQIMRVAAARHAPASSVAALLHAHTTQPTLGVLGEPRVNVLRLNLALDSVLGAR